MLLFDIEANGLIPEATRIWCLSGLVIDPETGESKQLPTVHNNGEEIDPAEVTNFFKGQTHIIGHNIIGYDVPMLAKFYPDCGIQELHPIDTYTLSKLAHPDRPHPKLCPHAVYDAETKTTKRIGSHGLEAWGYRVANKKPEISQWEIYSEDMLHRCSEDVTINFKAFKVMCGELGVSFKDLANLEILL